MTPDSNKAPKDDSVKLHIDQRFYSGIDDFTFFLCEDEIAEKFLPQNPFMQKSSGQPIEKAPPKQFDEMTQLKWKNKSVKGRLNGSRCFSGRYVSCSFRAIGKTDEGDSSYHPIGYKTEESFYRPKNKKGDCEPKCDAKSTNARAQKPDRPCFANSFEDICNLIYPRIFPAASTPPVAQSSSALRVLDLPHGLIVIAGATGAGKSEIARGLIYEYLRKLVPAIDSRTSGDLKVRRPHLVTLEDPIDQYWAENPEKAEMTGIDYTPRELGKDVDSLEDTMSAALRQKPNMLFVGETRDIRDWKQIFRFASTGHLCVTTSHAGSLTEAMGQLFIASEASSPAGRSEVARRVLALVHLQSHRLSKDGYQDLNVILPAIWVRSPASTMSLMADGLTSLLPYRDEKKFDCLGRSWFAEKLLDKMTPNIQGVFAENITDLALRKDLEGI